MKKALSYILGVGFMLGMFSACVREKPREVVLFDFESPEVLDQIQWKCHTLFSLSNRNASHGKRSLKVELYPSKYPGFSPMLHHKDWNRFSTFSFAVYNPGLKTIRLTLRIDDYKDANDYNDRYNKTFLINPGANSIQVSLPNIMASGGQRRIELKNIHRFMLFTVDPKEKQTLYLDYFRLISKEP